MSEQAAGVPADSPFAPVREDWLATYREEILDPTLPIIDPHHHLFDAPGWRYMFGDLLGDLETGHNVTETVFVECRAMYKATGPREWRPVGEMEFVSGVAAMSESGRYGPTRVAAGIVGHADLLIGAAVEEILQAQIRAGGGRCRGIRHITAWDADPDARSTVELRAAGLMSDRRFRDGFSRLAPLKLSFDAWLYHTQLPELLDLVDAYPTTTVVVDHVGGPLGVGPYRGRRDDVFAAWKQGIEALARHPNVFVKLGGMGMRIGGLNFHRLAAPPSSAELETAWRPYVETCIASFGPSRCMFESNFPVDKCSCSYPVLWNAFKRLCQGCSGDEMTALFSGTARQVYRL